MAFLDYHGLQKFTSQFKAWLDSIFVKTVNSTAPDSTGNVTIDKVAFADNFIADDAQSSSGEFITRTSGGEASIADGDAWLNIIRGNRVHSGFSAREVNMTVTPAGMVDRDGTITAAIDRATFVEAASESATISLHYSNAWDMNPAMYGITVTGTPADGDTISVNYTKEVLNLAVNAAHRVAPAGIAATLNKATFIAYVAGAGTYTLSYTTVWSEDPTLYGVTVTGTPENGDSIVITYDGTNDPEMTVNSSRQADSAITATINRATFIAYVDHDATITLDYTDSWSADPALYGVTVTGTPINGDQIVITYVKEVIDMTVSAVSQVVRTNPITATIDELAFDNAVQSDGTTTFSFTTEWNLNPASYGITVTNTPVNGDTIVVSCVKEVRGTIKTFNPVEFYSTNWNLYNHTLGYARTVKYSSSYGFILGGTFTSAKFSTTNDSEAVKTPVDLVDIGDGMYYFEVSEDGFVWLEGANDTDTYLFMTWSDWQSGPPATFAAHEASTIDLSSVMSELFPYGLMRVGSVEDEINLSLQTAYSRIERMAYSAANLATAKASGRAYEYDENYIYIVRAEPLSYAVELDGLYTANDHGLEVFTGTTVPGYAQMLYGQNLKDKLRTDVLTISAQTLSAQQKAQARTNIGAVGSVNGITGDAVVLPTDSTPVSGSDHYVTSGGVYTELAAINNRIGNVESPASVFNDVAFTIPTTAWSGSGTFTAIVSNSSISSTSGIWVFYDSSYTSYAKAPISSRVTSGGGSVTFTTTTKPTAAISGYIRIVDSVNGIIPVARGGTGAATPAAARSNLGCGNAATYGVANNLTTAAAGSSVLDAYQGKLLSDDISTLSSNTTAVTRHTRKASFSLSDLQAAVADQDLAKHGLKVGDETTINGHTYVIAGLNVMKGTHSYTCTSNHVGLIVIPHTTHAWNASGKTNEGADGRGAGYSNCDLQYYLENDVMAMCNTDLGSAHLYAHRKLMGNAINETGYNRFGTATGCTSGWAWKENCYISALTEAQVYGGDHWSSSGYDTGEANTLLPVFSEYKHTEIFKNEYPWLRNVSSASQACIANDIGHAAGDLGVSAALHVAGLILYH